MKVLGFICFLFFGCCTSSFGGMVAVFVKYNVYSSEEDSTHYSLFCGYNSPRSFVGSDTVIYNDYIEYKSVPFTFPFEAPSITLGTFPYSVIPISAILVSFNGDSFSPSSVVSVSSTEGYEEQWLEFDLYINGALPPAVPEDIYDFSGIFNDYNEVEPGMVKLQYLDPVSGDWVTVKMMYATGKGSPLDSPYIYSWGSVSAPSGIDGWRVGYDYGFNADVVAGIEADFGSGSASAGSGAYWMNPVDGEDEGFSYSGGSIDLIAPIDTPAVYIVPITPSGGGVTTIHSGGIESSAGLGNVGSGVTNPAVNVALQTAAGIRLAKPDLVGVVREGVLDLKDAVNAIPPSGGTSAGTVSDGVLDGLTRDAALAGDVDFVGLESTYQGAYDGFLTSVTSSSESSFNPVLTLLDGLRGNFVSQTLSKSYVMSGTRLNITVEPYADLISVFRLFVLAFMHFVAAKAALNMLQRGIERITL